jgi:hypothetical protein
MAENMEYAGFIAVSGTAETVRELQPAPEMLAEQAYQRQNWPKSS